MTHAGMCPFCQTKGKAVKPLPMYANAALASAFGRQDAATYASGGPVHHVIDVYKAAAPSLDAAFDCVITAAAPSA